MNRNNFIKLCFNIAKEKGFEDCELFFSDGKSVSLRALDGELSEFKISSKGGVNFRGIYKGRMGSAFSEVIDEATAEFLVSKSLDAACGIEDDDEVMLYPGDEIYPEMNLYNEGLEKVPMSEKIDYVLELEKKALALDGVDKLSFAGYSESSGETRIVNTLGLDVSVRANMAFSVIHGLGTHQGKTYTGYSFGYSDDFKKIRDMGLEHKFRDKLVAQFGAESISSNTYKSVLSRTASGELLSAFYSMFNAEVVQRGMSLLKEKIGEKIVGENISIVDDPLLEKGIGSSPFDSEGVACFKKYLVEKGELKTFMHNLKTAKKAGVKTTGNASRGYKGTVGISPSNLYIEPGDVSEEEMIAEVGEGFYITEFEGLHAGANAVSGDFSLSAKGFLIEGGKKTSPVNQVVVSGNYLTLLSDVVMIGDELKFEEDAIGSPALVVASLSVAGL